MRDQAALLGKPAQWWVFDKTEAVEGVVRRWEVVAHRVIFWVEYEDTSELAEGTGAESC